MEQIIILVSKETRTAVALNGPEMGIRDGPEMDPRWGSECQVCYCEDKLTFTGIVSCQEGGLPDT